MFGMTKYTMTELRGMTDRDIETLMKRESDKARVLLREAAEHFYEISHLCNVQKKPLTEKSYKDERLVLLTYANRL